MDTAWPSLQQRVPISTMDKTRSWEIDSFAVSGRIRTGRLLRQLLIFFEEACPAGFLWGFSSSEQSNPSGLAESVWCIFCNSKNEVRRSCRVIGAHDPALLLYLCVWSTLFLGLLIFRGVTSFGSQIATSSSLEQRQILQSRIVLLSKWNVNGLKFAYM